MRKNLLFATLVVLVPSFAMAHVSVRPRESKPGAEEQYTRPCSNGRRCRDNARHARDSG